MSLPSRTNAINYVSEFNTFSVTGATGDFLLVDSQPLIVSSPSSPGGISLPESPAQGQPGRTISLSTNSLSLQATTDSDTPVVRALRTQWHHHHLALHLR